MFINFDKQLLEELFPDDDFIFTAEDGTQIEINHAKERMKQKKKNLEDWIKNQEEGNWKPFFFLYTICCAPLWKQPQKLSRNFKIFQLFIKPERASNAVFTGVSAILFQHFKNFTILEKK